MNKEDKFTYLCFRLGQMYAVVIKETNPKDIILELKGLIKDSLDKVLGEAEKENTEIKIEVLLAEYTEMIEDLEDLKRIVGLQQTRKCYIEYVKDWRKRNNESDLTYPDFDECPKDYLALLEENRKLKEIR